MNSVLDLLPNESGALVVISGGLDSTISLRLAVEKYGKENVHAITFDYGQKQRLEIEKACKSTKVLGVKHKVISIPFFNEINQGFSSNVDENIKVPDLVDVLGDPQPKTYLANRNMILMAICASYAETQKLPLVIMGLQSADLYGYHDTTEAFVASINSALIQNRTFKIQIIAPFGSLSKTDELKVLLELDGNVDLTYHTLTCYNPDEIGSSCGVCASCSERLKAFKDIGIDDPIEYQKGKDNDC